MKTVFSCMLAYSGSVLRSKPTKCQTTDLRGKERAEQRIAAAGAKVGEAEVDERQFFSLTHS